MKSELTPISVISMNRPLYLGTQISVLGLKKMTLIDASARDA